MHQVGRIARAIALFCIDEVIIFDDSPPSTRTKNVETKKYMGESDPGHFLTHLLSYLEAPPFMRKALFPLHPNLRLNALLPSVDMPHHPRLEEKMLWKEGVTVAGETKSGSGTLVEVGLEKPLEIDEDIPPKTRVTLKVSGQASQTPECVHPAAPREEGGYYWGYAVRRCTSLSTVFTESPYEGGYDIGMAAVDEGTPVVTVLPDLEKVEFKHALIVFGGPNGLGDAAENDEALANLDIQGNKAKELFDHWLNILPRRGCRVIRSEEALFIGLTALQSLWEPLFSL